MDKKPVEKQWWLDRGEVGQLWRAELAVGVRRDVLRLIQTVVRARQLAWMNSADAGFPVERQALKWH